MKRILYGFMCLSMLISLQGCFWHSERCVEPNGQSSTTVVTPPSSATVTTTN